MAEIKVRFAGPMRRPWTEMSRQVALEAGATVGDVLLSLGYREHELRFFAIAVNGSSAGLDAALGDSDVLDVMLKVGGG